MTLLKEKLRGYAILITPNDVPASKLIEKLAKHMKQNIDLLTPPSWANIVKTGVHVEKQPQNPDWWYIRCASLLRKIYVHGPIGLEKLRADYGGGKGFTVTPNHVAKAGGAILRKAMQQLEAAGLVQTSRPYGRKVTREGRRLLREMAEEVSTELVKQLPELEKYRKSD
jgi:small subunit ribosomal protein S19e